VRGEEGDDRRLRLARHARGFRQRLGGLPGCEDSAIVPVILGDDREVMRVSERVLEAGVFVQGIRPPTVPEGTARLRIALSSEMSMEQLEIAGSVVYDATRRST
jgi:8-amino-7-oxononanoate synthase